MVGDFFLGLDLAPQPQQQQNRQDRGYYPHHCDYPVQLGDLLVGGQQAGVGVAVACNKGHAVEDAEVYAEDWQEKGDGCGVGSLVVGEELEQAVGGCNDGDMGDSNDDSHSQADCIVLSGQIPAHRGHPGGDRGDEHPLDVVLAEDVENEGRDDDVEDVEAV